jgi:hypothetical protein
VSLEAQRTKLTAYATALDLELVVVFEDAGLSAKSLHRPGLAAVPRGCPLAHGHGTVHSLDEEDDAFIDTINARSAAAEAGAPGTPAEQVFAELLGE